MAYGFLVGVLLLYGDLPPLWPCYSPIHFQHIFGSFHWILESWLQWSLVHYLDDFIRVIPRHIATNSFLSNQDRNYHDLTQVLGIAENTSKGVTGTIATMLEIEIDTERFEARLDHMKLQKASTLLAFALSRLRYH
jgi:hypothetical protein